MEPWAWCVPAGLGTAQGPSETPSAQQPPLPHRPLHPRGIMCVSSERRLHFKQAESGRVGAGPGEGAGLLGAGSTGTSGAILSRLGLVIRGAWMSRLQDPGHKCRREPPGPVSLPCPPGRPLPFSSPAPARFLIYDQNHTVTEECNQDTL